MLKRLLIINLMFVLLLTGFVSTSSAKNLYGNEAYKFRITFPEGWKVKKGSLPYTVARVSDPMDSEINITSNKNDQDYTADMLSPELIPKLLKPFETMFSEMNFIDKSETRVGNRKALMTNFTCINNQTKTSARMTILALFTINDGDVFIVMCSSFSILYDKYKKRFEDCISSLAFEDYIIGHSPVGTTNDTEFDYEELERFSNSIKKIHPDYEEIVNKPKFKEYISSLPTNEYIKALLYIGHHTISSTEAERIMESGKAEEQIRLISNYKINKAHPGYPEIVNKQKFKDYINNLPWQKIEPAIRIIKFGTVEEIIELISNYKFQEDYQESHRLMIKEVIDNYNVFDESSAISILQDWINKEGDSAKVIRLSVKDSNSYVQENSHLVTYTIARGSNKQKSTYKFNLYANVCKKVVD